MVAHGIGKNYSKEAKKILEDTCEQEERTASFCKAA